MVILASDILGLRLILWGFLRNASIDRLTVGGWLPLWALLPFFLVLYWFFDAYPGVSVNPVAEIRNISLANTSAFLFLSVMLMQHRAGLIPHLICLSACVGASVVTLVMRAFARYIGSQFEWWGYPVVLFGGGPVALSLLHKLLKRPTLGLRPVAVVADKLVESTLEGIPIFPLQDLDRIVSRGVRHAIVAAPELSQSEFAKVIERSGEAFSRLILIPNTDFIWKVGSDTRDLMGTLGIQARNNLLDMRSRAVKRTIDLAAATLLMLFLLPLIAIISLSILLESGFPVFYCDRRLGCEVKIFNMWKFRTMARNSAEALDRYLATNPELRGEWNQYQKLRNDPRITRVGRVLRKTSLDELPQLWNVIKGQMSLVGPRPRLLEADVPKYQVANSLYGKATPGLTGLWQVSGRNQTTYEERIAFDAHYIRNWSVWMDIYLLAKTIGVVITGDGAY